MSARPFMKPIDELPSGRGPSDRTRREVQSHAAHDVIRAAQRAEAEGTADEFQRDLLMTLAEVQAEEFGGSRAAQLRKTAHEQLARWQAEDAVAEQKRRLELRPEMDEAAQAFLARFAPAAIPHVACATSPDPMPPTDP